jgi:hypothetical protein
VFLQFADDQPWYFLLHETNDFQENVDCPAGRIASPVGEVRKVTTYGYDKRLVENIHDLFTTICGGKSRLRERCIFCS